MLGKAIESRRPRPHGRDALRGPAVACGRAASRAGARPHQTRRGGRARRPAARGSDGRDPAAGEAVEVRGVAPAAAQVLEPVGAVADVDVYAPDSPLTSVPIRNPRAFETSCSTVQPSRTRPSSARRAAMSSTARPSSDGEGIGDVVAVKTARASARTAMIPVLTEPADQHGDDDRAVDDQEGEGQGDRVEQRASGWAARTWPCRPVGGAS